MAYVEFDDEDTVDEEVDEVEDFAALGISGEVISKLRNDGIMEPTEVQWRTVPRIQDGKDVMAEAETGSGKTLAFGLPLMERVAGDETQVLILSPTRELARQIARSFRIYSDTNVETVTIYGGVDYGPQIKGAKTANVVVGTPGRVLDLLQRGDLDVSGIDVFVLDEADRMLDMGFRDELEAIMEFCPGERQNLLFGATIPGELEALCDRYGIDPVTVRVSPGELTGNLEEKYIEVDGNEKISALLTFLQDRDRDQVLVFCKTRSTTWFVAKALRANDVDAEAMNGDMSQPKREDLMQRFKDGDVNVVVATDVAARGLHVDNVTHVFNYNVPDQDTYTHRIGRAGRQGAEGEAITLLEKDEHHLFRRITRQNDVEEIPRDSMEFVHATVPT